MAEVCAFKESCPMEVSLTSLSGICTTERGEVCGPAAGYAMLTHNMDGLVEVDETAPIVGTFTFDTVPVGDPPLEVRESWVGVSVPVRFPERVSRGDVQISDDDAILSLLSHGRLDAAAWFTTLVFNIGSFTATFRANEGEFADSEVTSSTDYYGSKVPEQVRAAIEQG